MSDSNEVIKDFSISKRINEAPTTFSATFNTPLSPDEFVTGSTYEFEIQDNTLPDGFVVWDGIIETIDRNHDKGNQIYGIGGRDTGRLLVKQPFSLDCTEAGTTTYTVREMLGLILTDTDIIVGRGQTPLAETLYLNTSTQSLNRFCGSWNTKQDAINQLFSQYQKLTGCEKFRWYIDFNGDFRWFETRTDRAAKTYIFDNDDRVTSFKVKEDATNIINIISGTYGSGGKGTNPTLITLTDSTSIATYGKCYNNNTISEQYMGDTELRAKLQKELDQKKDPIYTATLEMDGFYYLDPGMQLVFPDDPYYPDTVFTVVDLSLKGSENAVLNTSINLTTDETATSIVNEFEVVQAIAAKETQTALSDTGVVTSIDGSTLIVKQDSDGASVPAQWVESLSWG